GLLFYLRAEQPIGVVSVKPGDAIMGSAYMAEKSPRPSRSASNVILNVNEFSRTWTESPARLLVFVRETDLAGFSHTVNAPPRKLSSVNGIALMTNHGS